MTSLRIVAPQVMRSQNRAEEGCGPQSLRGLGLFQQFRSTRHERVQFLLLVGDAVCIAFFVCGAGKSGSLLH